MRKHTLDGCARTVYSHGNLHHLWKCVVHAVACWGQKPLGMQMCSCALAFAAYWLRWREGHPAWRLSCWEIKVGLACHAAPCDAPPMPHAGVWLQ